MQHSRTFTFGTPSSDSLASPSILIFDGCGQPSYCVISFAIFSIHVDFNYVLECNLCHVRLLCELCESLLL